MALRAPTMVAIVRVIAEVRLGVLVVTGVSSSAASFHSITSAT
jgi:hypothetical protein